MDAAYPATPTVPESGFHSLARRVAHGALVGHFADRADCFVGEDRNIYYRFGDSGKVLAPDVFVCFGVDPARLATAVSYRVFEVGAPPAFVLEIASEGTVDVDLNVKPDKYLEMGVEEYWRFDPSDLGFLSPPLQGERRVGGTWRPIQVTVGDTGRLHGHSLTLGLTLHAEGHRLRFHDPVGGQWLLDPDEERQARVAAETRAAAETARADQQTAARHAADRRAAAETARAAAATARAAAAEAELAALRAQLDDPPE